MSHSPDLKAFKDFLTTLGVDADTLPLDATLTLRSGVPSTSPQLLDAARTLPTLHIDHNSDSSAAVDLRILGTLGAGGMGQVLLANQLNLDREVAVKSPHADSAKRFAQKLLQEAYITGYLEHPNIIPIYTLGRDENETPLVVMKCVEGQSWQEILEQEGLAPPTDLDRHIAILLQVCNALRFAHSRGVIHRDIKPENVMIGHFGEVYLLDWGIALSLRDDRPLLPTRDSDRGLSGTPGFLAPEMATQSSERIDERTDVYLLGATLHTILTGELRHQGENLLQILFAASQSEPAHYDDAVPQELAIIANRACHLDPEQRFPSVEAFAQALQDFLHHRESIAVSTVAEDRFRQLETLLLDDDPDRATLHDTYGECRFGFQQALRMWPQNARASQGLQLCLEAMANHHLRQNHLESATACIADLPHPRPDLTRRLEKLRTHLDEERANLKRLQRLEKNLDLKTATTPRRLVALGIGLLWTFSSAWAALQQGSISLDEELHNHMLSGYRNVIIFALAIILLRKHVLSNSANRRLVAIFSTVLIAVAVLRWATWYLGEGLIVARTGDSLLYVLGFIAVGLVYDYRIAWLSIFFALSTVVGVLFPSLLLPANSIATFLTFAGFVWLWRPPSDSPPSNSTPSD